MGSGKVSRLELAVQRVYNKPNEFWTKVEQPAPDECWEWIGERRHNGYGQFWAANAHRVSWWVTNGPIPAGMYVCHRCDNRLCVNPRHLFLGTPKDNSLDAKAKGRTNGGKPQGLSHAGKHERVLAMLDAGKTRQQVADALGMTERNVYYIQKKHREGGDFRRQGRDLESLREYRRTKRAEWNASRGVQVPSVVNDKAQ